MTIYPGQVPNPVTQPQEYADYLFDTLSGGLRDAPDPLETLPSPVPGDDLWQHIASLSDAYWRLRADFAASDRAFAVLHEWIASGGTLPGPWRANNEG